MRSATVFPDVLVVGGGPAGVAAAAAAGRAGAQVVLLERYGFLGGLAASAQVGTACGLYLRDMAGPEPRLVAGGFVKEFASCIQRAGRVEPLRLDAGLWILPLPVSAFGSAADAILQTSGHICVIRHATVAGVEVEGDRVIQVQGLAWSAPLAVRPKAVVDCTGEATVAGLAGAVVENGAADQAPAIVFSLEQVDADLTESGLIEVRRALRLGVESGALPAACERIALVPGANRNGRADLKLNLSPADPNRPLWEQVTCWEREARKLVVDVCSFLRRDAASCANARLAWVAPQLGVRSGGRIQGRARLADEEVLGNRKQPGGIARGCWPMERWSDKGWPALTFSGEQDYYEIALDCLRPVKLDNLFACGRCLSAAPGAMSSARVIGTALSTGWAAGSAAAFQVLGRPLDEAVQAVRGQMNE